MKRWLKKITAYILCFMLLQGMGVYAKYSEFTEGIYTYTVENGMATITYCDENTSGEITIPKFLGEYPVTTIGDYAFRSCTDLTSVIIPDWITSIGNGAFHDCGNLINILIPETVSSIEAYAFSSCSSLESIIIPDGVTSINGYSFEQCYSLEYIKIPESVKSIGRGAFMIAAV